MGAMIATYVATGGADAQWAAGVRGLPGSAWGAYQLVQAYGAMLEAAGGGLPANASPLQAAQVG